MELAEREARASTLSHPNLPVYIEHFEEEGALYLVMEKIEGGPWPRFVADATLTMRTWPVFGRCRQRPSVLTFARSADHSPRHQPGNVILRRDGSFAFVDFGSVRDQLKPEGGSTVVGTFGYMAPERISRARIAGQ